jgi:hypothetical protein
VKILLLLALVSAHRIEQKVSMSGPPTAASPPEQKSIMLWDGAKLRTDNGAQSSSIVDFKTDNLLMLDHEKKQYTEMKVSEMIAQMKRAMEAMKAQAASFPPEQRKAYEDMIQKQTAPLTMEATQEKQKIIGLDATKFLLKQGGAPLGEVWYTKGVELADLAPYAKQFADMMKGATGSNWGDVFAKTENGYPLRSVIVIEMMGKKMSYVTETVKYEKVSAAPSDFAVPAGYKKVDPNAAQLPGKTNAEAGGAIPAKKAADAPKKSAP